MTNRATIKSVREWAQFSLEFAAKTVIEYTLEGNASGAQRAAGQAHAYADVLDHIGGANAQGFLSRAEFVGDLAICVGSRSTFAQTIAAADDLPRVVADTCGWATQPTPCQQQQSKAAEFYNAIGQHFAERQTQPVDAEPMTEDQRDELRHDVVTGVYDAWWGKASVLEDEDMQEICEGVRRALALPCASDADRWRVVLKMVADRAFDAAGRHE